MAVTIALVAAAMAVAITTLRAQSDDARHAQLVLAHLDVDAQRISRVEWQVTAAGLTRELGQEFRLASGEMDGHAAEYERENRTDGPDLSRETAAYVAAVAKLLALIDGGHLMQSETFDERYVDPSFARLQRGVQAISLVQKKRADKAAGQTDVGITASLLIAALALVLLVWRFDTVRHAAARKWRENLEVQALHDALTGLPNRRKLLLDLEQALLRAHAGESCALILCDLDGFKTYNDTFGHLEGDLLLERLSDKLARALASHGTAYRLGGDEFCGLLRVDEDELAPLLSACHAALCETGGAFEIRASIGCVRLPEEARDAAAALRLADLRMYAQKNEGASSVKQQLRGLMLSVLCEQDPELYHHVHHVAHLAAAVGRQLGFDDARVAMLVRAAELHDVGKLAVPDSILNKPGPLDADEQQFMRRHTLIGESILGSAPALAGIGRIVRSTHERYDGTGYPDALRETQIPLSSRIIFVCDSFDAMTTNRSYRKAMSEQAALAELTCCAGTQFDPAVVDAFMTVLAASTTTPLVDDKRHTPEPASAP
jgi:diguanylate cyclase (GGDEF)-like protein